MKSVGGADACSNIFYSLEVHGSDLRPLIVIALESMFHESYRGAAIYCLRRLSVKRQYAFRHSDWLYHLMHTIKGVYVPWQS